MIRFIALILILVCSPMSTRYVFAAEVSEAEKSETSRGENPGPEFRTPAQEEPADAATAAAETTKPSDEMSVIMKPKAAESTSKKAAAKKRTHKAKKTAAKKSKAAPKIAETSAPEELKRNAETSLRFLNNGNNRFVRRNFRADGRNPEDREKGLIGESPHSAIVANSDSRVVPEIIFDQGLGELYTVRTFGENLEPSVIAALEYAVEKLKVPLIVVMANSDSAAIKLQASQGDQLSPSMKAVAEAIRPRLKTLKADDPSPSYEVEATLNADGVARELTRKSEILRAAVENKSLTIKSALYRISTGRVTFY